MPEGFDRSLLGRPFSGTNTALRTQILFSYAFLSPTNCSPEEAELWTFQWDLEGACAIDKQIELTREAQLLGIGALWDLRPDKFLDMDKGVWLKDPYTYRHK